MKYLLPHSLPKFLDMSCNPSSILIIESEYYVKDLLSLFCNSKIYFVTSDIYKLKDISDEYSDKIAYVPVAYNQAKLPFSAHTFDIILGDELLAENFNPQDIASGLGSFLKPTGYLLTSFSNLLFKPWTDKLLREERSEFIVRRGYTREDFERLMVASFYKEVFFEPLFDIDFPEEEPPFYMAKAYVSTLSVRNLKSLYSSSVRKRLSVLLHRIEYGVDVNNALTDLKTLIKKENIFDDYLYDFIKEACYSNDYVINLLRKTKKF